MKKFWKAADNALLTGFTWLAANNAGTVLKNQRGNEWINLGLIILIISLPLAAATIAVVTVVSSKYTGLSTQLGNVPIPNL